MAETATLSATQGSETPLLRMRGLRLEGRSESGWQEIVKGVDLDLGQGEILGLIGESGAGKSTIGLAAMGYARGGCRISGGSVLFDGQELVGAPERVLRKLRGRRVAYVAQSAAAAFNPAHRLIDQYVEMATVHGRYTADEARSHAVDLFRELQLPEPETFGERFPHQVSGGQLQRAMVAMAMACGPDLLVFDEPTTALDVTTQIEVLAAIKRVVGKHGASALYITHDLAVVAQLADRIMVLRFGEVVETGPTRDLLRNPRETYTRRLLNVRALRKAEWESETPVLRIDGIDAAYGVGPKVLMDIDVTVPRQTTVAIVGESGAGKSTLARVITGLLPPASGGVRFHDTPLPAATKQRSRDQLRRLQMIHQNPDTSLNPRQTVREIVGRPLRFYLGMSGTEMESRLQQLLTQIDLGPEFLDRFPGELSGGQKQRICIARALAAEPEVIICDEVTSALDQLVGEGILKLLMRLQEQYGIAYIFITHDIATVRAIADRVVVMHMGRIVEQGSKSEILNPPHADYTQRLLSSVPEMDPDWLARRLADRPQAPLQAET
jgi:peptide/nickel transport system ATP-binding protein